MLLVEIWPYEVFLNCRSWVGWSFEMGVGAVCLLLRREQTEERKYVADANTLVLEVRLSSTALAEQAFVASEHRIFMAKVISRDPAPRSVLDNLA